MVYAGQVINCLNEPLKAYDRIMTMCGYRTDYGKYVLNFGAWGLMALAVVEVLGLSVMPAPYGRYAKRSFGPLIPAKFAWFASQLPSLLVPLILFFTSDHSTSYIANYMLLGMFMLHYAIKTFIHPLIIRGENPMPLVPFIAATLYCTVNGYLQAKFLLSYADYGYTWVFGFRYILGSILFLVGMLINISGDATLAQLRSPDVLPVKSDVGRDIAADAAGGKGSRVLGEERHLAIPHGGLFEYVSSANFTGELIEWLGFAIAAWSLPALAHFLVSCGNLIPRALQHHRDYIHKFKEEYPKNRRAVIPGVL